MKSLFKIVLLIILFPIGIKATEPFVLGETERVYSLPKTELMIEIVSEKIKEKPGIFSVYAEKYLGTRDVITVPKHYFNLKQIIISTRTQPDEKRTFRIIPKKKSPVNRLVTNSDGILCGVNIVPQKENKNNEVIAFKSEEKELQKIVPLTEEYIMAGSVSKMAEGAAKQIFRIRESRLDLLSGYSEDLPKDGETIKTLMGQMDIQEKQLTELFVGATSSQIVKKKIVFTPTRKIENVPLFRYSKALGVVDKDDLVGEPIYLNITYNAIPTIENEKKKKFKYQPIYTIIPVKASVEISFQEKVIYQKELFIPQLGILQPIPYKKIKRDSKIYIDAETGRMLSIIED